jgi:ABC-type transporter Mla MlaB component
MVFIFNRVNRSRTYLLVTTMEKPKARARQLNVIADISGAYPLLHDFSPERKETSFDLHVNFSNVKKIDSVGLSILLGLIFIEKKHTENYEIEKLTWSNSTRVNEILNKLKVVELLNILSNGNTKNMIQSKQANEESLPFTSKKTFPSNTSLDVEPLQSIELFSPRAYPNRQDALDSFSRSLKSFMALDKPRTFNHEQIIKVFIELAKNTFDHSNGIGIAGLTIYPAVNKAKMLRFVYCDTGDGICLNVRNYLSTAPDLFGEPKSLNHLKKKGSAIDFLHKALQAGFSTKHGNGVNHGMGLTLISQGAAGCGFNIWLRDANSIIDLSDLDEPYTHESLRAKSAKTSARKLLMFHIEREIHIGTTNSK